jgi:hypothetical protein
MRTFVECACLKSAPESHKKRLVQRFQSTQVTRFCPRHDCNLHADALRLRRGCGRHRTDVRGPQRTAAFADSAALAAALRLNSESGGLTRARSEVSAQGQANYWYFGTKSYAAETITVEFGRSVSGSAPDSWTTTPPNPPTNYSFTRVSVRMPVPLYFLPVLTRTNSTNVAASAIAGQLASADSGGVFPFTSVAHNRTAPGFGLTAGVKDTLKWASSPKLKNGNVCEGDDDQ